MKWLTLAISGAVLILGAASAGAVDHNNIDAGRPLRFDDAEAIAFREQALEGGLRLSMPPNRPLGFGLSAEYLYGFAPNSHLSVGFDPSIGGRAREESTSFDFGEVGIGLFHNFNREYGNTPALSVRGDVFLPSGRDSRGVDFRVRGIASKQAGQYGRAHLNLDLNANTNARREREFFPGMTLGYTHPLGYPTHFDTTGLAELSVQAGERSGTGPVIGVGVGVRKQITVRSVLDFGVQSDLIRVNGAPGDRFRFVIGYSTGF